MIVASRQTSMRTQITCLLILSLTISPALAWNGTGHKIIASIAFRQLTAEGRAARVAFSRYSRHSSAAALVGSLLDASLPRGRPGWQLDQDTAAGQLAYTPGQLPRPRRPARRPPQ